MDLKVRRQLVGCVIGLAALTVSVAADTLILRNGRRIEGQLVGVRNGVIEFQEEGFRGSRIVRVDRDEVAAIELEENDDRYSGRVPGGRPRGLREREVVVSADVAWIDTGIDVRSGQDVYFSAVGRVRWGPDRRDGPAGERNSPHNPNRPIPHRPAAALIGKVSQDSRDYFLVGDDQGPIRMRASGRLHLGVNDDFLSDNSGNFRVTIFY